MADKKISALTGATTPLAGTEVLPIVQGGSTVKVAVSDLTAGRAVSMLDMNATQNASVTGNLTVGPAAAVTAVTISGSTDQNATYGRLQAVYTGTSTSANSGITVKNYQGTSQFMQWDIYGIRIGSRIVTNTGQGQVIFTYGNDAEGFRINTSGNIVPGAAAKGIDFTANTPASGMTSQLLNWYEEGTFTPTVSGVTLTVAAGRYTRIGRTVFVEVFCRFPSTSDTTTTQIGGLPFTPATEGNTYFGNVNVTYSIPTHVRNIVYAACIEPRTSANATFTNTDFSLADVYVGGSYTV